MALCICACFWTVHAFAGGYDLPVTGKARVSYVQGHVSRVVEKTRTELAVGDILVAPAGVVVGEDARLELIAADGSVLRFAPGTTFTLTRADAEPAVSRDIQVDVAMGDCWAKVQKLLGTQSSFEVNSPTAVAGVAGTVYRLRVEPSEVSKYYVYDGKIAVSYSPVSPPAGSGPVTKPTRVAGPQRVAGPHRVSVAQWMVVVAKGYRFNISPQGQYQDPEPFDMQKDRKDPWVAWNLERDNALNF